MFRFRWVVAIGFLAMLASGLRADAPAAEFKNGHWEAIAPPAPPVPVTDAQLDHIQQLLDAGNGQAALDAGVLWIKSHDKTAPLRDRLLFEMAQAKYQIDGSDDWVNAFYYCDELMEEYPESKYFYPALQLQYTIADRYLSGHKKKFFGLAIFGMESEAVEMLYRIQERSPGSALAEKALLRTCDYYYSTGQYELAHDAYGFYIKTYPRSTRLASVKLRQAFASLAQFRDVKFDPTCIIDARAELQDIIAAYPAMAREQKLATTVERIDQELGRKLLLTADFYRRTSAPRGAVYMYRYLVETYPDSKEAAEAKKALETMPKSALAEPPPRAEGFSLPEAPGKGP